MNKSDFVAWARQPTTIHAFGAVALGATAAVAHYFGASDNVAIGCGMVSYALTHMGINDNSASKGIEKLIEDAATAYVTRSVATALPNLLADAQNVAVAFVQPATSTITLADPSTATGV